MTPEFEELFLSLVQYTCPHGYEETMYGPLMRHLGAAKDDAGNYFLNTDPNSTTLFVAHMDTAHGGYPEKINTVRTGDIIKTDGKTLLGADDRAGLAILLWMIHHKVPGTYLFTVGEERGLIGARAFIKEYTLAQYSRAIEFDRRGTTSVITYQSGRRCCSDAFADELIDRLNLNLGFTFSKDTGGSYTDTHAFAEEVPECTNISVGYRSAHSYAEEQDVVFLARLANAAICINWETLETHRDPTKIEYLPREVKSHGKYPITWVDGVADFDWEAYDWPKTAAGTELGALESDQEEDTPVIEERLSVLLENEKDMFTAIEDWVTAHPDMAANLIAEYINADPVMSDEIIKMIEEEML